MILPFRVDADTLKADFQNGVLTVAIPKPAGAVAQTRNIAVK